MLLGSGLKEDMQSDGLVSCMINIRYFKEPVTSLPLLRRPLSRMGFSRGLEVKGFPIYWLTMRSI